MPSARLEPRKPGGMGACPAAHEARAPRRHRAPAAAPAKPVGPWARLKAAAAAAPATEQNLKEAVAGAVRGAQMKSEGLKATAGGRAWRDLQQLQAIQRLFREEDEADTFANMTYAAYDKEAAHAHLMSALSKRAPQSHLERPQGPLERPSRRTAEAQPRWSEPANPRGVRGAARGQTRWRRPSRRCSATSPRRRSPG